MNKSVKSLFLIIMLLGMVLISITEVSAITRTARTFNYISFQVGFLRPVGTYDQIGIGSYEVAFRNSTLNVVSLDAEDVYKNSNSFGFTYGNLAGGKIAADFGFYYTNAKHKDEFIAGDVLYTYVDEVKIHLYDLGINCNYYFMSPVEKPFAPYVGAGLQVGLLNSSVKGFDAESNLTFGFGLNFGADIKIWQSPDKFTSIALSSINQYQFLGSGSRPKYLSIGGGLKYYFNQ